VEHSDYRHSLAVGSSVTILSHLRDSQQAAEYMVPERESATP
jgi:hypothetical protein